MLINSTLNGFWLAPSAFSVCFFLLLLFLIIYIFTIFVKPRIEEAGTNVKTNPLSIVTDNLKVGAILLAVYLVYSYYIGGFLFASLSVDDAGKVELTGQVFYDFEIDKIKETVSIETNTYSYKKTGEILLKQIYDPNTNSPYLEEVVCTYTRFPMEMKCKGFVLHSPEVE